MQLSQHRFASIMGLLQAAAVVTAVFSVCTIFEQLHRYIELFSHFRLQYLIVSLLLALVFISFRIRNYAVLMMVVAAVNAVPVVPWYLGPDAQTANVGPQITVLHANVLAANDDYRSLAPIIATEQPAIVFLQEMHEGWAETLAALAEDYPYSYFVPRSDNFGIAVISRQPFGSVDQVDSPPLDYPTLVVRILLDDSVVTFVSTHPMNPIGKGAYDARNEQLADIGQIVAALDGPSVLIGDLNVSMWSNHYRKLEADTGLRNARVGFGVIPTWPTFLPFAMIPIDHCLVSRQINVLDVRSGPRIGSDHLPLLVTLALL